MFFFTFVIDFLKLEILTKLKVDRCENKKVCNIYITRWTLNAIFACFSNTILWVVTFCIDSWQAATCFSRFLYEISVFGLQFHTAIYFTDFSARVR